MKLCSGCKEYHPFDNFGINKSKSDGLSPLCKPCYRLRSRKKNHKLRTGEHGRLRNQLYTYKSKDKKKGLIFDLDLDFMITLCQQPCTYCGSTKEIGADRFDNNLGHIKSNVHPCCLDCNLVRGDRYTFEEMKIIGAVLKQISEAREK